MKSGKGAFTCVASTIKTIARDNQWSTRPCETVLKVNSVDIEDHHHFIFKELPLPQDSKRANKQGACINRVKRRGKKRAVTQLGINNAFDSSCDKTCKKLLREAVVFSFRSGEAQFLLKKQTKTIKK